MSDTPDRREGHTPPVVARWRKFLDDKDRQRVFITANEMMRQAISDIVGAYHAEHAQQAEEIARRREEVDSYKEMFADAARHAGLIANQRDAAESQVQALRQALEELIGRIANGHPQSIGSIDNVRMVQFRVDEIDRYRAALAPGEAAPKETQEK